MIGHGTNVDDLYINLHLNTHLELPTQRDTVLHFFEQMKKAYPDLVNFFPRESGDLVLEGEKESGHYRWVAIEPRRLCSGHVNPRSFVEVTKLHELVLEFAPPLLTISPLDCDSLDLMYGFDFTYEGNHDEVVAEAFGAGHALESMLEYPGARLVKFEPNITLALDDSLQFQCRVSVETRTEESHIRSGNYPEDQISVYFTVRRYWANGPEISFVDSYRKQRQIGEEMVERLIIPQIVRPLAQAIASK